MGRMKLFIKSFFVTLLFTAGYSLLLIWARTYSRFFLIVNILIYFIIAQKYIEYIAGDLWMYIGKPRGGHKLTAALGTIDQIIYLSCFALEQYHPIGLWLSIKIASRLIGTSKVESDSEYIEEGQKRNAYLIGSALSLILGILGGILLKKLLNNNFPYLLPSIKNYLGLLSSSK